ncbi:MAG: nicotinamidase [Firmicutes bacterium]|jgi:nicotinamidase/pyrazinamidase|uniref:nicotinamidase n=1 Tax=Sulfobacillus benefaciens TaxID=453960 RepID=A0A2T2X9E3_9FIRM|nr:nicotinamidase [Bacillota bacterium]MCL5013110.1 nicotinamidase [Bacillota bacterium]PSR31112.1 MAG: nicotinamidase [Sulfobacillus benefaciens]
MRNNLDLSFTALIVVDFQNDFCPGGTLAVSEGDQIYPVVQDLVNEFEDRHRPIVFTRDYHPSNHISFVNRGGPWPPHCVQGTYGFEFFPKLRIPDNAAHFFKGYLKDADAYSGFEGCLATNGTITGITLESWLHSQNVHQVYITGLATDYCVKATAIDATRAGFDTIVITNGVKGVNVSPHDSERALNDMKQAGACLLEWPARHG